MNEVFIQNRHNQKLIGLMRVMRELGWQEKQKVVVKKRGKGIIITDWKK